MSKTQSQSIKSLTDLKTTAFISIIGRHSIKRLSAILIFLLCLTNVTFSQIVEKNKVPPKDFTKRVWLISHIAPGYGQFVNKDFWKIPVFYGGMGSMLYMGINANQNYQHRLKVYNMASDLSPDKEYLRLRVIEQRNTRNLYYAAAGAFYLASVVDAVYCYNDEKHSPVAATIFSTIVPGLGQVYNKKYWKVPVIYGGLSTFYFIASWNNRGYTRFKTALKYKIDDDPSTVDEFNGERSADELRYYMDSYRRNRDISILGFSVVYILNVLDANVDAHLYDWNVDDDLGIRVEPAIVNAETALNGSSEPVFGLSCKFTF